MAERDALRGAENGADSICLLLFGVNKKVQIYYSALIIACAEAKGTEFIVYV